MGSCTTAVEMCERSTRRGCSKHVTAVFDIVGTRAAGIDVEGRECTKAKEVRGRLI